MYNADKYVAATVALFIVGAVVVALDYLGVVVIF